MVLYLTFNILVDLQFLASLLMNLFDISGFKPENVPSNLKIILKHLENSYKDSKKIEQEMGAKKVNEKNSVYLSMSLHISQDSGKQISVGMQARILPDNVKHTVGTLKGEVESIYPLQQQLIVLAQFWEVHHLPMSWLRTVKPLNKF